MSRSLRSLCTVMLWCACVTPLMATVSGTVTSDTVWTSAAGPVVVSGTVTVPAGITLTIQPGATVQFAAGSGLVIAGKIIADNVLFTSVSASPSPGAWNGIEFQNAVNVASLFRRCAVEYGGGGPTASNIFYKTGAFSIPIDSCSVSRSLLHGINTRASSPSIRHCAISDNLGYGIYSDLLSNFTVDSCSIVRNVQGGIRIPTNSSPSIYRSVIDTNGIGIYADNSTSDTIRFCQIRKNTIGIQVAFTTGSPVVSDNNIYDNSQYGVKQTGAVTVKMERNYWGALSGPFHPIANPNGKGNAVTDYVDYTPWLTGAPTLAVTPITANITVATTWSSGVYWVKNSITVSAALIIKPNVIVKFASGAAMTVTGSIVADGGTSDSAIVFTSDKDDVYGGDSNGDGFTTQPGKGDWNRLELNAGGNAASVIRYCLFQYGGSGGSGNLYVYSVTPSVLSNITSINGSSYGIRFYLSAAAVLDSSIFSGNNSYGIYQSYGYLTARSDRSQGCSWGIVVDGSGRFSGTDLAVTDNTVGGISADGSSNGATLEQLTGCIIARNKGVGVYNYYGTGPQSVIHCTSENNLGAGFHLHNVNSRILFSGDTSRFNGGEGIVSSKASFINNVLKNNTYPIAQLGALGSVYSGNTISGNLYNNAIALRSNRESFKDTLRNLFPAGMVPGAYVFTENTPGSQVAAADTLVIEPGVIIKFADNMNFYCDGTLLANGSSGQPIIITSWRDSSAGGKTVAANDFSKPAPNDWQFLLLRTNADNSQLSWCTFRYGGRNSSGLLYLNGRTFANIFTDLRFRFSGSMGIRAYNAKFTLQNSTIDSCATFGIHADGNSPRSDVVVRNCTIQDINGYGLRAVSVSAFREVSNSIIRRCVNSGVMVDDASIPQTFLGDSIAYNLEHGIVTSSSTLSAPDLQFFGNFIVGNTLDGIVSSAATFIDNTIAKNRFPVGCFGRIGNIYTDNAGVDGNTIVQNTYNHAVLLSSSLSDTLKNEFPAAMGTNHAYVVQSNINVPAGKTLVIDTGAVVKFQSVSGAYYNLDIFGTVIAVGTPAERVIFTSWRDNTAGGKTSVAADTAAPVPGDWNHVAFRDGSGNSVVRNVEFRYGGQAGNELVWFESNLGSLLFTGNRVWRSASNGLSVSSTALTLDSCTVTDNNKNGLFISNNVNNSVRVKNTKLLNNGQHGIYKDINAKILEITNATVSGNGLTGITALTNPVKATLVGNRVMNNGGAGIYFTALDNATDSLLLIAGTAVRNNGGPGLVTSRAYIIDDSLTGNRYAVSVTGQLSLAGSGNNAGNVYAGTVTSGNVYEGTLGAEGILYGTLGQVFPPGYTSHVIAARGDLSVPNGQTLDVAPGTIVKFSNEIGNAQLFVDGVLHCNGTAGNRIIFTSWKDDIVGGDTNLDSALTVPTPGNWKQIYINSDAVASTFQQTLIKFGGAGNYAQLECNGNNFVMDSCTVSYGQYDGCYIYNADPVITGSDFHHNNQSGIAVYYSSSPVINYNNIYQNGVNGLLSYFLTAGDTIDARNNYWGTSTGPYVNTGPDQNLGGTGNKIAVSGMWALKYRNFLPTRSGLLYGDVSGNGQISAYDGSLILQYLVNPAGFPLNPVQLTAANVSGDSTVSALDASYILRYVVGLISGFPGLGKISTESASASAYTFSIVPGTGPDQYELVVSLSRPANSYGVNIGFLYDTTRVKPVTVLRSTSTDSMVMFHYADRGKVNIALAGVHSLNSAGIVARIPFTVLPAGKTKDAVLFTLSRFILNEQSVLDDVGSIILHVPDNADIPVSFGLEQNYPNPFNPATSIRYSIPEESRVTVTVYSIIGQKVRDLAQGEHRPGTYTVVWDGKDDHGNQSSSGVYFCRISALQGEHPVFTQVRKMLMVK